MQFLQAKHRNRLVQAASEGLLLPDELSPELEAQSAAVEIAKAKKERARGRRNQRTLASLDAWTLPAAEIFQGKLAFLENAAWAPELHGRGMHVTADVAVANIFVVADPATEKLTRWRWSAVLRGGYCFTLSALTRRVGSCVKFKAALQTRRWLFVSRVFREKHAGVWAIIDAAASADISKWKLISRAQFLARRAARPAASDTFALTVRSDNALLADRCAFEGPLFFARISEVEQALTGVA